MDFGKCCPEVSHFIFDQILISLAGNEDNYKILDNSDLGTDGTINMRVTCPLVSYRHITEKMLSG